MKRLMKGMERLGWERPKPIEWGEPLSWWSWAGFAAFVAVFVWVACLLADVAK